MKARVIWAWIQILPLLAFLPPALLSHLPSSVPHPPHPTAHTITSHSLYHLFTIATAYANHSLFRVEAQGVGDFCQFCAENTWETEMLTSE